MFRANRNYFAFFGRSNKQNRQSTLYPSFIISLRTRHTYVRRVSQRFTRSHEALWVPRCPLTLVSAQAMSRIASRILGTYRQMEQILLLITMQMATVGVGLTTLPPQLCSTTDYQRRFKKAKNYFIHVPLRLLQFNLSLFQTSNILMPNRMQMSRDKDFWSLPMQQLRQMDTTLISSLGIKTACFQQLSYPASISSFCFKQIREVSINLSFCCK